MSADWLFAPPSDFPPQNSYGCFRAWLPAGTVVRLWTSQYYEARVNGRFLAHGPAKSGEPLLYFDTLTLTGEGDMVLFALKVHARKGAPAIWCRAFAPDGGEVPVEWRAGRLFSYDPASPAAVGDVGFCEWYRLDGGENRWAEADFDDSGFSAPVPVRELDATHLHERPIPMLRRTAIRPVAVEKLPAGVRVDFGEMVYGRVLLRGVRHTAEPLEICYIEHLTHGWANGEGHRVMFRDKLTGGAGAFAWESFAKRGFRYLELEGALALEEAVCEEYAYPVRELGEFRSSDERLDAIWRIARRTLEICMDDIFNDCPHRDQAQWMDAFVSSKAALGLFGVTDLARKSIVQHAICSFKDGKLLSPSIVGWSYLPDYALVQIRFIEWYARATGDRALVNELYDNAAEALAWFQPFAAADGLLDGVARDEYLYLDNAFELCKIGKSAALNALYYGALNAMAEMGKWIGRDAAAEYRSRAAAVRASYLHVFAHPEVTGCFRDSDARPEYRFWNLNFTRILHLFSGSGARASFRFHLAEARRVRMRSGAYTGYRAVCNGEEVCHGTRPNSWQAPAPCFAPEVTELNLHAGENTLVFDVEFNGINWDLFFDVDGVVPGEAEICEIEYATGKPISETVRFMPRVWNPPYLSQTTQGYAAFSGLLDDPAALKRTVAEHYYRNFISIRVPLFSTETDDPALLAKWIMPANTPWTAFFFLTGLFDAGCVKEGLDFMRMAWGVMTSRGATNAWEEWSENASLCHAWGASPTIFMQRDILGVHQEKLGEGIIVIRPALGDLEFAEGRVAVAPGVSVGVSLKKHGARTEVKLDVPDGYRLELDLSRLENPECSHGAIA